MLKDLPPTSLSIPHFQPGSKAPRTSTPILLSLTAQSVDQWVHVNEMDATGMALDYLESGRHSDFEMECGGYTFQVHKIILALASPYFRTCCDICLEESHKNTLSIPGHQACLLAPDAPLHLAKKIGSNVLVTLIVDSAMHRPKRARRVGNEAG